MMSQVDGWIDRFKHRFQFAPRRQQTHRPKGRRISVFLDLNGAASGFHWKEQMRRTGVGKDRMAFRFCIAVEKAELAQ